MTVYMVQNNDELVMAIFRKKSRAKSFTKRIGLKRWNEKWKIVPVKLNKIDTWVLVGCESYRDRQRRR